MNVLKDLQPGGGIQFNEIGLVTKTGVLTPPGGLYYNDTIAVFIPQYMVPRQRHPVILYSPNCRLPPDGRRGNISCHLQS